MLSAVVTMCRRRGAGRRVSLCVLAIAFLYFVHYIQKSRAGDATPSLEVSRPLLLPHDGQHHMVNPQKVYENEARVEKVPGPYNPQHDMVSDDDIVSIFVKRLARAPSRNMQQLPDCSTINSTTMPCFDRKCPPFSPSPGVRLRQILSTRSNAYDAHSLAVSAINKYVYYNKYLLVTAVSENHYYEMQALVKNLHADVFPRLKNFTLIIVDLGLTEKQRRITKMNCRCSVVEFPFKHLPSFFKNLQCFTWKVFIIRALLQKSEYLVYMDASIRWNPNVQLEPIFRRANEHGLQVWGNNGAISLRTSLSTFKFYSDLTCQYSRFAEVEIGIGVYHNQPFVRKAILDPWVSCAFDDTCMCLRNYDNLTTCYYSRPRMNNGCHRFDQSSMSIILTKLYLEQRGLVWFQNRPHSVKRGDEADWFKDYSIRKHLSDLLER